MIEWRINVLLDYCDGEEVILQSLVWTVRHPRYLVMARKKAKNDSGRTVTRDVISPYCDVLEIFPNLGPTHQILITGARWAQKQRCPGRELHSQSGRSIPFISS